MLPPLAANRHTELRSFALALALFLTVVFWGLLPWWRGVDRSWSVPAAASAVALLGLLWPRGVWPVYALLRPVLNALSTLNTWLLLGSVYFSLITPLGWVLRKLKRLQYVGTARRQSTTTYRIKSSAAKRDAVEWRRPF
jgi:hypothetical protein